MADNKIASSYQAEASNTVVNKVPVYSSALDLNKQSFCQFRVASQVYHIYNYFQELVGISILEVYSITYLGTYPMEAEDQIGVIFIKTNDMTYHLYHERKLDTSKPSIKYGDQLPMWRVEPICSFTKLELIFESFSDNYNKGSSKEFSHSPKDGDVLANLSMKSRDGYKRKISVLFGCFSNATVANLEVMFLPEVPDAITNVYGVVVASNSKFDQPSCISYLFSHDSASTIQVEHDHVIPLSKSRVGVPLDSKLNVDISLFCNDIQHKGAVDFNPNINGEETRMVGDQIQVKVTWNCNEDSYFTDEDSNFTDEDSYFIEEYDSAYVCEFSDIQKEILDSDFIEEYDSAYVCEFSDIRKEILETVT
ncbi:hypothetical protein POM88_032990 [Heracleum sosnowskyi]|uniref:DUF6598 domain-containing protein n=1 Tax=Heracleum sosnowskyi TaxID=360622 RepID=A0AAD8I2H4_9APIA|nr:hypothetical protein POM88_032990 [Heracleum sosnowskyi]